MANFLDKRWEIGTSVPPEVETELKDYSKIMRQLLFNREICTAEAARMYLDKSGSLYDPFLLTDMERVVERLLKAVALGERVFVYGDYDVDGVTATALLVQVLHRMGGNVKEYIPHRFEEGYGLNFEALEKVAAQKAQVVVTVDCGIRSPAEVLRARELGIDLIITDHHEPTADLPEAYAIICPKRTDDDYPDKNLAGVGVTYKLVEALLQRQPVDGVRAEDWLDLVAVGTVADVVPLSGENRALVKAGLALLRSGRRQGLVSLAGAAEHPLERTTARDIGFVLGPRLNAAGRLESALESFRMLTELDASQAGVLAQKLDDQNRRRQELTLSMQLDAEQQISAAGFDHLLFVVSPKYSKGVVGLVASRLTETYYRPSVVGAYEEEFTRASCRSIPEFHITHALDECADLMVRHGGHAMAAGFTVRNENLPKLIERLQSIAARELAERDLRPVLRADMEIPLADLRYVDLRELSRLEPCGLANPGVTFVSRNLNVGRYRRVGRENQHLKMTVNDGKVTIDAIAFRQGDLADEIFEQVDLLYAYEKNEYRGIETMQLNVRDIKRSRRRD